MKNWNHLKGITIILNEEFPYNTMEPHYYYNKITRRLEVDSIKVSEDIYNKLKNEIKKDYRGYEYGVIGNEEENV